MGISGLLKPMLMIRKKVVCFKEGKQLFGDNCLHSLRDSGVARVLSLGEGQKGCGQDEGSQEVHMAWRVAIEGN